MSDDKSLNAVYSKPTMTRRYEAWFLKLMLTGETGAWWFRYLIMNLGRQGENGCHSLAQGMPAQVWATWFPRGQKPQNFIQGFDNKSISMSERGAQPFNLAIGDNRIDENSCKGQLNVDGHLINWDLRYMSRFKATMSDAGWIGFSRTPHSDALFSGEISFDDIKFSGELLGYGVQGHNCGYRHRNLWNWMHAVALDSNGVVTTFEALQYEIGLGLWFRRAILWHPGQAYVFKKLSEIRRDSSQLIWQFTCMNDDGLRIEVEADGSGPSQHRLPYMKTDCSGTITVGNNSFAKATLLLTKPGQPSQEITANGGAVIEMGGLK